MPRFVSSGIGVLVLALTLSLLSGCRTDTAPAESGIDSRIEALTEGFLASPLESQMSADRVPGVSIAVINENRIEWARGFGVVKAGAVSPVTAQTVFPASSISKALTSAIALKLVREKRLELDSTVNSQLTTWQIPGNEFTAHSAVTLRNLLSHSGCVNRPDGGFGYQTDYPSTLQILKGEPPATNLPARIECVPGSEIRYSNMGYIIVQQLIEDAADRPFARLADDLILKPSEMNSSTFQQPLAADLEQRAAFPHDVDGDPGDRFYNPSALGQGGLWTTPSDLARFAIEVMRAVSGDRSSVISPETAKGMLTPGDRNLANGKFWGLGFLMLGDWAFFQAGSDPGFRSLLAAFPGERKGIVVMVNGDGGELLQLRLLLDFMIEYLLMPRIWIVLAGLACIVLLLSVLLCWTVGYLISLLRRLKSGTKPFQGERASLPSLARLLAFLNSILFLLAAWVYLDFFLDPAEPLAWNGSTPTTKFLLASPFLSAGLSIGLVCLCVRCWREHYWTLSARIHFTLATLAAAAVAFFGLELLQLS